MRGADIALLTAVIKKFGEYGIEAGFVVPTAIGLEKSILDATAPLRRYLQEKAAHDYSKQLQGPEEKIVLAAEFVWKDATESSKASLYRPKTKGGDPRIWFSGLRHYARPNDLLAIIFVDNRLAVVNVSNSEILGSLEHPDSPLASIAQRIRQSMSSSAARLLGKLRKIAALEFVPSVRAGDTGVGATLEALLEISANCRRTPDFEGIEIKASRHSPSRKFAKNRVNLFSQVPDWKSSKKTAIEVLTEYGHQEGEGRLQLYCTVSSRRPNSQGLLLVVEEEMLHVADATQGTEMPIMTWSLTKLRYRLNEKHPESFWVKAEVEERDGKEYFRYYEAIHTSRPFAANFAALLGAGVITLDLTMSENGKKSVRDHGYLFKIWPEDFASLFPPPNIHWLTSKFKRQQGLPDPAA